MGNPSKNNIIFLAFRKHPSGEAQVVSGVLDPGQQAVRLAPSLGRPHHVQGADQALIQSRLEVVCLISWILFGIRMNLKT